LGKDTTLTYVKINRLSLVGFL